MNWNFFLALFGLTSLAAASMYWVMGALGGFRLWSKLPGRWKKVVKAFQAVSLLSLLGGATMAGVALTRGCGIPSGGAALSVSAIPPMRLWRPLGKLDLSGHPFQELLEAQAKEEAKSKAEAAKKEREEAREARKQAKLQAQMGQILLNTTAATFSGAVSSGAIVMMGSGGGGWITTSAATTSTATTITVAGNTAVMCGSGGGCILTIQQQQPMSNEDYIKAMGADKATRKGPFCHVTCSFHHRDNMGPGTGDVEVEARWCNENRIKEDVAEVMGWERLPAPNDQYEVQKPWPGPAQGGLDRYTFYWDKLETQSAKSDGGAQ